MERARYGDSKHGEIKQILHIQIFINQNYKYHLNLFGVFFKMSFMYGRAMDTGGAKAEPKTFLQRNVDNLLLHAELSFFVLPCCDTSHRIFYQKLTFN